MLRIGSTERGDAGIDFTWTKKLQDLNIIISKNLNDKLIGHLIDNQDKIIFHSTVTGHGGTIIEPKVPKLDFSFEQFEKLILAGFDIKRFVLRVDPIIPTEDGLKVAKNVLEKYKNSGVERVRFSFLDMYEHVKIRFKKQGIELPYSSFHAPKEMIDNGLRMIEDYEKYYTFESCGEYLKYKIGCISKKDLEIAKIKGELNGSSFQRKACLCPANKKELLKDKKVCQHQCIYCYWQKEV
jgi:DNA repair photolyase